MSRPRLIALLLGLITLLVYLPVTRHDFLSYDDDDYVTNNWAVQRGLTWAGVRWAFTTCHAANWHPLTWLSHMADCELFGLNPGAHHFVNVLLHAGNAALCFGLLWRLTRKLWPAVFVAVLFAWHPLHVESVAWVAERKDELSTFFGLLALLSYVRFAGEKSWRAYGFSLLFFGLSLLAKPMLVTLPFLLLLLDFWPLGRLQWKPIRWNLLWEKAPFFLLTAVSCIVTLIAQRAGGAVVSLDWLPLHFRFENAAVAMMRYLGKIFWPADLAVLYPPEFYSMAVWGTAMIALALISLAVWWLAGRNRCWLFGWLWFLGTLVPVIGLVQVGGAAMADRYMYLPSLGIFVAVVFGLEAWLGTRLKQIALAGASAIALACVAATEKQLSYWQNTETLFRHTLAVTQDNEYAHINLGRSLEQQGRLEEAIAEYSAALTVNPDHAQIHYLIGLALLKNNQPPDALSEFRRCIEIDPHAAVLHNAAAGALAAAGNLPTALEEFGQAERLDPNYVQPHLDLAKIYFQHGDDGKARDELAVAVRLAPADWTVLIAAAHYLAVNTNAAARDGQSAVALAMSANALSGEQQPEVFDVLGMALAAIGDFTNAVVSAQNALEFAPAANPQATAPLRQRLELYQKNQPWLESFRGTNASAGP